MKLPDNKTKIVCTIGPASEAPETLERLLKAGMNVARLNFSHGSFDTHRRVIGNLRAASKKTGHALAILADLPGPKMRIKQLKEEPLDLESGSFFTLTTEEVIGDKEKAAVTFAGLPQAVKPGDKLFLNDGFIELEAVEVHQRSVKCKIVVGGELRSRKGLNLPGIKLGISAFTGHDHECLKFAMQEGVDAVSQSFVENAGDILAVRKAAQALGASPFIIAKIERSAALASIDSILEAADGIMIARGDLGVEMPIEQMAVVQKDLLRRANLCGKPVITATHMLESMTVNNRPTRAEATDVANAILDGTDCVMLSGESATGKHPVEAVLMLAKIAAAIEPCRSGAARSAPLETAKQQANLTGLIAGSVEHIFERAAPCAVFAPTHSGYTARNITRFRLPVWIVAVSSQAATCQSLQFSYGVYPVCEKEHPDDWNAFIKSWLKAHAIEGDLALLTEGPSNKNPLANHRIEMVRLK